MSNDARRRSTAWTRGQGQLAWQTDERAYAVLLDALAHDRLEVQAHEREMIASPRVSLADVRESQQRTMRDELAEARRELSGFRDALRDARQRSGSDGQVEVPYDSSDPVGDEHADMLIQYLVRPGYAEVRTEEPDPGHYVYYIQVDWVQLEALAQEHGHPIDFSVPSE